VKPPHVASSVAVGRAPCSIVTSTYSASSPAGGPSSRIVSGRAIEPAFVMPMQRSTVAPSSAGCQSARSNSGVRASTSSVIVTDAAVARLPPFAASSVNAANARPAASATAVGAASLPSLRTGVIRSICMGRLRVVRHRPARCEGGARYA
jgi:hypothetical protein